MANLIRDNIPQLYGTLLANMSETITYEPQYGARVQLQAIVNDPADLADEAVPTAIRFKGRESDFGQTPQPGDRILYGATRFTIQSVQRNQYAWLKLGCSRVSQ